MYVAFPKAILANKWCLFVVCAFVKYRESYNQMSLYLKYTIISRSTTISEKVICRYRFSTRKIIKQNERLARLRLDNTIDDALQSDLKDGAIWSCKDSSSEVVRNLIRVTLASWPSDTSHFPNWPVIPLNEDQG